MKIAIESDDGVTLKSPFTQTKGYIICEVENTELEKSEYVLLRNARKNADQKVRSAFRLSDCRTVISRGMNNKNQSLLKEKGIEVFITFKTKAKDALSSYLKEKLINHPA
jgi:predicted Fe-Mo cluster-binding NifX family protein